MVPPPMTPPSDTATLGLPVPPASGAAPAVMALTLAALCGDLPEMMLRSTVDHDLPSMADHRNMAPPPAIMSGTALLGITGLSSTFQSHRCNTSPKRMPYLVSPWQ